MISLLLQVKGMKNIRFLIIKKNILVIIKLSKRYWVRMELYTSEEIETLFKKKFKKKLFFNEITINSRLK